MTDCHSGHIGDGIQRPSLTLERDAEIPRPLSGMLGLHWQWGQADQEQAHRLSESHEAGERKTKYTAPTRQRAAQR